MISVLLLVSNGYDPDLGLNCLQRRLSADNKNHRKQGKG